MLTLVSIRINPLTSQVYVVFQLWVVRSSHTNISMIHHHLTYHCKKGCNKLREWLYYDLWGGDSGLIENSSLIKHKR